MLFLIAKRRFRLVTRREKVHIEAHKIIIDKSTIKCEETHQCNHISQGRKHFQRAPFYFMIVENKIDTNSKKNSSMSHITKHYSKEEGKSDSRKYTWINLLISGNTIGICNLLSNSSVRVCIKSCRGR